MGGFRGCVMEKTNIRPFPWWEKPLEKSL